jgi:hypothetical protein
MLTDANFAANRVTLKGNVIAQLNLPADQSTWSYDQTVSFNKAFAAGILAHPDSFSTTDLNTANAVTAEAPSALSDTSLAGDISAFGSAVTDNVVAAGNQVAGIGTGVLSLASLAQYIIPIAGVVIVGVLLFGFYKKHVPAK